MNMLSSGAMKAICSFLGIGVDLAVRDVKKVPGGRTGYGVPAKGSSSTKAATAAKPTTAKVATKKADAAESSGGDGDYDPSWDGSALLKFTKHKGTAYNELEDGLITWLCNLEKDDAPNPDKGAVKERARRLRDGKAETASNVSEALGASDDDDEIPF